MLVGVGGDRKTSGQDTSRAGGQKEKAGGRKGFWTGQNRVWKVKASGNGTSGKVREISGK